MLGVIRECDEKAEIHFLERGKISVMNGVELKFDSVFCRSRRLLMKINQVEMLMFEERRAVLCTYLIDPDLPLGHVIPPLGFIDAARFWRFLGLLVQLDSGSHRTARLCYHLRGPPTPWSHQHWSAIKLFFSSNYRLRTHDSEPTTYVHDPEIKENISVFMSNQDISVVRFFLDILIFVWMVERASRVWFEFWIRIWGK